MVPHDSFVVKGKVVTAWQLCTDDKTHDIFIEMCMKRAFLPALKGNNSNQKYENV